MLHKMVPQYEAYFSEDDTFIKYILTLANVRLVGVTVLFVSVLLYFIC